MKIVGIDNFAREAVADSLLVSGIPDTGQNKLKAKEFCDWLNTFTCDEVAGGTFYVVKDNGYRLSRGMEDLA